MMPENKKNFLNHFQNEIWNKIWNKKCREDYLKRKEPELEKIKSAKLKREQEKEE